MGNMSYITCPTCGEVLRPFGESKVDALARKYGIKLTAQMPIDPELAKTVDEGKIESIAENPLSDFAAALL